MVDDAEGSESECPKEPQETKAVQVAGLTESLRKKELQRLCAKMEAKGWILQSYHDEGISKSKATFSRPMDAAKVAKPKSKLKMWHFAVAAVLALFVIGAVSGGGDEDSAGGSTQPAHANVLDRDLAAYKSASKTERTAAIGEYLTANGLPAEKAAAVYNFMSEAAYTKNETLKVADILGWAKREMSENGGNLGRAYVNLDNLEAQFSPWDGSHRKLEQFIKRSMNDEDSYKHVETRYRVVLAGEDAPYLYLTTTFSGKNAFGGTIKQTVAAKADISDGTILQIIQ